SFSFFSHINALKKLLHLFVALYCKNGQLPLEWSSFPGQQDTCAMHQLQADQRCFSHHDAIDYPLIEKGNAHRNGAADIDAYQVASKLTDIFVAAQARCANLSTSR